MSSPARTARRTAFVATCTLLGVAAGLLWAALGSSTPCTTAILAIQSSEPGAPAVDTAEGDDVVRRRLETMAALLETDPVAEQAAFRLPANDEAASAQRTLETAILPGSGVLQVSSCRAPAARAATTANAFADALVDALVALDRDRVGRAAQGISERLRETTGGNPIERRELRRRLTEYVLRAQVPSPGLRTVAGATPERAEEQRPWLLGASAGGAVGLIAGLAALGLVHAAQRRRAREPDLERAYRAPPLATVPRHRSLRDPFTDPLPADARAAGANLAGRVLATLGDARSVAIVSPERFEGRSTVAVLLARSLAETGRRILLVEADLAHPALADRSRRFEVPGLADIAAGTTSPLDAVVEWPPEREPVAEGVPEHRADVGSRHGEVALIHAGARVERPEYLLGSPAVGDLLRTSKSTWDLVVLDMSAGRVPDGLAGEIDAMLLISRPGVTDPALVSRYLAMIEKRGGPRIVGYVLDGVRGERLP